MLFFEAIIDGSRPEGHRYTYRETNITPNEWITAKPWAIQQDVFIQDFDNKVEFGWVDSSTSKREDGSIEISGLEGGIGRRSIKCWMKIPMPYEDMEGWNFEYLQDFEHIPEKNHQYLVCVVYVEWDVLMHWRSMEYSILSVMKRAKDIRFQAHIIEAIVRLGQQHSMNYKNTACRVKYH